MIMSYGQKKTGDGRGPVPAKECSPAEELVPILRDRSRTGFDGFPRITSANAARTAVFSTGGTVPPTHPVLTACGALAVQALAVACLLRVVAYVVGVL